ncbi:MAG: ComEA family DNA-binding protein, partial [Acutalibacteraceae bacterium]
KTHISETANPLNELININTAKEEELKSLYGIGENRAKAIISYRKSHGKFSKKSEIKNVKGIGEAVYNKIKNKITV